MKKSFVLLTLILFIAILYIISFVYNKISERQPTSALLVMEENMICEQGGQ